MKRALISDIHSNWEALEAVWADIETQGVDEVYCLGDVIGYGPNPRDCISRAMGCKICILGNHDWGALCDPEGFNSGAERAIFWTRDQLEKEVEGRDDNNRRWEYMDFLGGLPRTHRDNGYLFVHGSAKNPLNEYVFPEDIYNQRKMERIFSHFSATDRACFQGHTHVPGVFTRDLKFMSPDELKYEYRIRDDMKVMINVGSVGQPRDGDCRSCYVVLEDDVVRFRRIEYPIETTVQKIYAIPELDNFLGDRLRDGR